MIELDSFRRAVDTAKDHVSAVKDDLKALYRYIGLPIGNAFSTLAATTQLHGLIFASFPSGHAAAALHCTLLRRELILANVLDGSPIEPYFSIVQYIFQALKLNKPVTPSAASPGGWTQAIQHAVDLFYLNHRADSDEQKRHLFQKDYVLADTMQRLAGRGYTFRRELGNAFLDADSEKKLVAYLEQSIAQLGGLTVADTIFYSLRSEYDERQERYHYVRRPSLKYPQHPFGYLLHLAAKHPLRTAKLQDQEGLALWRDVLKLSADYAALYEVQPYSQFELMFKDGQTLVPFLHELALYDLLFLIPQVRGSDIIKIARGLLPDLSRTFGSEYSLEQVLRIADSLLKVAKGRHGPGSLTLEAMARACPGIAPVKILAILEDVFVHALPGANQRFSMPTDSPDESLPRDKRSGPDLAMRPLIRGEGRTYWMLNSAMAAPAFLEAIFSLIREKDGKAFDDAIGTATENFLVREFAQHGIATVHGEYGSPGQPDGECDLVVETIDTVIFIELKKKSLTRSARAGTDAALVIDLGASLLQAQLQAGAHELRLRRDGHLDLTDQQTRKVSRVTLGTRNVERIAVTLMEFGSFQNRSLLDQYLSIGMRAQYSTTNASLKKKFAALNKYLAELKRQTANLIAVRPAARRSPTPFFNCWFLSVPQLLFLLDDVTDAEGFKNALWRTRHMETGSLDFYFDHSYMLKLPALAAAEAAASKQP